MFYLTFPHKPTLKIDFNFYPFKRVRKSIFRQGIYVDSLLDIAINKLMAIVQRSDIKDFVDFYFLEPKFGQKQEPYCLASNFLKIEDFEILPRLIQPVSLEELKRFFRKKAKEVGRRAVIA